MQISFIIVNFKNDSDTLSIVSDLNKNQLPKDTTIKIIVVDNSRSKDLEKALQGVNNVVYIDSQEGNVGFAGGNNLGFKKALEIGSDYLVMINNDTQAPVDLVKNIVNSPIKDKHVGIVGGLIYFAKGFEYEEGYTPKDLGKVIWYAGGTVDWDNVYVGHRGVNDVDHGQYAKTEETDFVTGCLFITRADVINKVGVLDDKYFMYLEDANLNMRVKKAGYKIVFDPQIKIWHKVAQSSGIGSPLNDYFLTRNRLVFGMTFTPFRTKFALIREAIKKLFIGTKAQKTAVIDFFTGKLGKGSWIK